MGQICSKVSIASSAISPSYSNKRQSQDNGRTKGDLGSTVASPPQSNTGKEFHHPFASSYSYKNDTTAWNYVKQSSMVLDYVVDTGDLRTSSLIMEKINLLKDEEIALLFVSYSLSLSPPLPLSSFHFLSVSQYCCFI
jgi:hypothetical protein